ncbi:MAG TPA: antibiotic biosynthesis monooxygenase [Candidatus Limnocylindrales bacterium]|nr:antibiotic biosynthesis monooxygenase [Candidatus Limnocylindrales bacterium]
MIARTWRGVVRAAEGPAYLELVALTGMRDSRATPGNRGFYVMQRTDGERAQILTVSLWDDMAAVRAFAGDDPSRAVFYSEDDEYLLERDLHADHWHVVGEAD